MWFSHHSAPASFPPSLLLTCQSTNHIAVNVFHLEKLCARGSTDLNLVCHYFFSPEFFFFWKPGRSWVTASVFTYAILRVRKPALLHWKFSGALDPTNLSACTRLHAAIWHSFKLRAASGSAGMQKKSKEVNGEPRRNGIFFFSLSFYSF